MPPERARRQEPVSCQRCRKKKLKCDRQFPCANCHLRNESCEYLSQRSFIDTPQHEGLLVTEHDFLSLRVENDTIKQRLRSLEEAISHRQSSSTPSKGSLRDMESTQYPLQTTQYNSIAVENFSNSAGDPRWLEMVAAEDPRRTSNLTSPITIRVTNLQDIIDQSSSAATKASVILLPTLDEAIDLFKSYLRSANTLQHIIHHRTVCDMVNSLYVQLQQGQSFKLSHVALTISMMACAIETWEYDEYKSVYVSEGAAMDVVAYWLRAGLDILEQSWRSQSPDLTIVQAAVIMIDLLYHAEAVSPKVRFLLTAAISLSKDIGLHVTDSVTNTDHLAPYQSQTIEKEIRRRIWWQLISIDWCISCCGAYNEGVYIVNPKHIKVNRPRNINDEDLTLMPADYSHPFSQFTSMTYYLYYIRIGEVCREVADIIWELGGLIIDEDLYMSKIVPLDAKFQRLLDDLPPPLSLECPQSVIDNSPRKVTVQRYFTNLLIHARRCKLHLRYLLRAAHNDHFAFSRRACLNAARSILGFRHNIFQPPNGSTVSSAQFRHVGVLHHFFCAVVVLVMDLCVNRGAGEEEQRKAEIKSACSIFEDARQFSPSASLFLDALMVVMRKHRVRIQTQESQILNQSPAFKSSADSKDFDNTQPVQEADLSSVDYNDLNFEAMWQSYLDLGPDVNPSEWDALFANLGTAIQ